MKILAIHADFIEFSATKKALKDAPSDVEKDKNTRIDECLVIFTALEKQDEADTVSVLEQYLAEIKKIAAQLKAQTIVLYPYAHLSSDLASPKAAQLFLEQAQQLLGGEFQVERAPFGWYKIFNIKTKGHPLSELSRSFSPQSKLKREAVDEPFALNKHKPSKNEQHALSAAALAGLAITSLYKQASIGSIALHREQAYVDIAGMRIGPEAFSKIEKQMKRLVKEEITFEKANPVSELQKQIAADLAKDASTYKLKEMDVVSLYNDAFLKNTKELSAFKLTNAASAYWKGNEDNEQLTRLYVAAFPTKEELEAYLKEQEDLLNRSHIKIGKEQGLFVISPLVGAGLPLLAPKGMILRDEVISFLWQLHKHRGYKQVWTPHIAKKELYKKSGHWDKFGDELFKVRGKSSETFVIKPMNCPHHMQIFDSFALSYRDMPVRFFEPATIYRDEKSGQLHGLSRVRSITQDDGHLFCRVSQIEEEVSSIVEIVREFYQTLGMNDYWVSLSVRGEDKSKYLGSDDVWQTAEKALEKAAKKNKLPYKRIEGEAAFYGPKLDFMFNDVLGREWQLATIQCDFNMPERFKLSFMNEESKKEQPVVIHRAICGSIERFMSLLIEHFAGKFPLWLSPVQVKIVTITDRNIEYAYELANKMRSHDLRVEVDDRAETMGRKVRDAQLEQANYILTVGDKEQEEQTISIRTRSGEVEQDVPAQEFIEKIVKERDERSL